MTSPALYAGSSQDCMQIKQDRQRLKCYDANARSPEQAPVPRVSLRAQAEPALKALRKINGSTELGISMLDYSHLVLEQVSIIDEALRDMPDGELKDAIAKSREAYIDARTLWGDMFSMQYVSLFLEQDKAIYSKYNVDRQYLDTANSRQFAKTIDMNMSMILKPAWEVGKERLERAEKIANDKG
ncbi:hypothetical protein ASD92_25910 [Massilia sp. Root1485]|nr:hypothetical protein ASD92_25910 [Massilia sp. Root1485]